MTDFPEESFVDHYAVLGVDFDCERTGVRKAFREKLLEAHPDKSAEPADGGRLARVMRAWEILGDDDLRDAYDRIWRLKNREDWLDDVTRLPHVTESERPQNRARSILFLLLENRGGEALERLRALGEAAPVFLRKYLDSDEFIDSAFLIAELFEERKSWFESLEWLEHLVRAESGRRRHRPCYPEALDRTRRLLIRRTQNELEPRVALEYLRRAEALGLDRAQKIEVARRRSEAYLEMGMRVEAFKHLEAALELHPRASGLSHLRRELHDLFPDGSRTVEGSGDRDRGRPAPKSGAKRDLGLDGASDLA